MKLYLLRHGQADWPDWNRPDDERPLTEAGREELEQVAKLLAALAPKISLILSSPLPRAWQTAEIVAKRLGLVVTTEPALAEDFDMARLEKILKAVETTSLLLVGHEPSLSRIIEELTGTRAKVAKGGVALINLASDSSQAELVWLFPPKVAKH